MARFVRSKLLFQLKDAVHNGEVPVTGTAIMDVMGVRMFVTKWTREYDDYGPVTIWEGEPIDKP